MMHVIGEALRLIVLASMSRDMGPCAHWKLPPLGSPPRNERGCVDTPSFRTCFRLTINVYVRLA